MMSQNPNKNKNSKKFVISDTHFFHKNILKVRPQFSNVDEMNRVMVESWNAVVEDIDTVYHLGDVSMWKPDTLEIVKSLKGIKYLIRGNHDNFDERVYREVGFKETMAMKELSGCVLTHVPVHPQELYRWKTNIHGHIHNEVVMQPVLEKYCTGSEFFEEVTAIVGNEPDPRYVCVSVEQTNYGPLLLTRAKKESE